MSMWTRQRHTRGPRNFREEIGGRVYAGDADRFRDEDG